MILWLIKRALKAALHEGIEEWALEVGMPRAAVQELRARRLALAEQEAERADAVAARDLGVDDEDRPRVLPMPSAAQVTGPAPVPGQDDALADDGLMEWVRQQRDAQVGWAEIARLAAEKGHALSEEALRCRFRRWQQKNGQDAQQ